MIRTRHRNKTLKFEQSIIRKFLQLDGRERSTDDIAVIERASGLALKRTNLLHRNLIQHINKSTSDLRSRMKELKTKRAFVEIESLTKRKMYNAWKKEQELSFLQGIERYNQRSARKILGEVGEPLEGLSGVSNIYKIITDMVISKIENQKELAWRKPWQNGAYGIPATNFITKKPYRGFNSVVLNMLNEHANPYWLTFKQIERAGGQLQKGAKSEMVIYYELIARDEQGKRITNREYIKQISQDKNPTVYPLLRYYRVFNGDNVEGINWKLKPVEPRNNVQQIESCETILEGMPKKPVIKHGGTEAYYTWTSDKVQMPEMKFFDQEQSYYSTLFHELSHATRHPKRLNQMKDKRPRPANMKFGDPDYAKEELVAEMSAAFLCGHAGILYFTLDNSAAYVKSWRNALIKHLKNDNKFIIKASSLAQESADYILGNRESTKKEVRNTRKKTKKVPVSGLSGGYKQNRLQAEVVYDAGLGDLPEIEVPEITPKLKRSTRKIFQGKITSSENAAAFFRKLIPRTEIEMQENFLVLYLDRSNKPIGYYRHSKGGIAGTVADQKLILGTAIKLGASSLILSHNHPSGNLQPSQADIGITSKLVKAAGLMDLALLDHIIITKTGYLSFADDSLMNGLNGIPGGGGVKKPEGVAGDKAAPNENEELNTEGGFIQADQRDIVKAPDTFRLKGPMGDFLGDLQPYKLAITISGPRGSGKTYFTMDMANAFIETGLTVGFFSLEQGGLESKDTRAAIDTNVKSENQKHLAVTGEADKGIETVKQFADRFDVIIIDSWQKLGLPNTDFDRLRQEHPNTIWIVIFQLNAEGGMRNGVAAEFDAPVVLRAHNVDHTIKNNYVSAEKNRGNDIGEMYLVLMRECLSLENLKEQVS